MKFMVKGLLFGAVSINLINTARVTVTAASIDKIKIRLEADMFDEAEMPVLDAESLDDSYVITGVERISEGAPTGPAKEYSQINDEKDKESVSGYSYEIEVESDEETFSVLKQDDIKFTGLNATCSKAVRKDNGEKLLLTIELQDTGELIGNVEQTYWDKTNIGRWNRAPGAAAYLVMLYRNDKRIGHPHRTTGECYDFSPLMQEAGIYHFKVFPLTKQEKRGRPAESAWKKLTDAEALQNKEQWNGKISGWQSDGESPAYILKDGMYPQMDSLFIDEEWYRFNERGEVIV